MKLTLSGSFSDRGQIQIRYKSVLQITKFKGDNLQSTTNFCVKFIWMLNIQCSNHSINKELVNAQKNVNKHDAVSVCLDSKIEKS